MIVVALSNAVIMFLFVLDTATGVKLYLVELVAVINSSLSAQSWAVKRQAGAALSSLAEKTGDPQPDIMVINTHKPLKSPLQIHTS